MSELTRKARQVVQDDLNERIDALREEIDRLESERDSLPLLDEDRQWQREQMTETQRKLHDLTLATVRFWQNYFLDDLLFTEGQQWSVGTSLRICLPDDIKSK